MEVNKRLLKRVKSIEIICSLFRQEKIIFKSGLNVVIGDDNASNSIGKSTFLMVLDFIFGGKDFLETNKDVIDELGHHEYLFYFKFDNTSYYFKRKTNLSDVIFICDEKYGEVDELSIKLYLNKLSELYKLPHDSISFRAMVGLYSRIWPKENLMEVKKPLHILPAQSATECIDNLIKTFNLYDGIASLSKDLKDIDGEKSALKAAFNKKIISKINKTQFKSNTSLIDKAKEEILDIKENLAIFALDLKSLINKDVLDAKVQKDRLLDIKFNLESKLFRVRNNLQKNKIVTSKTFGDLGSYFSDLNLEKLEKIEGFHSSLSSILKQELKSAEADLILQIVDVDAELIRLERVISASLQSIENPNYIVDRVFEISTSLIKAKTENDYFESINNLKLRSIKAASDLSEVKIAILDQIMERINKRLELLTVKVYGSEGKSPTLILADKSYEFTIFEDTGTGKAYSNLILFDLAILSETKLPFLIHDSVMYKNVENNAVANLIKIYASFTKQSFIAIDEVAKYGDARKILESNEVLRLTSKKVLYIRNWKVTDVN